MKADFVKDENPPQNRPSPSSSKGRRRSGSSAKFTVVPRSHWVVAVAGVVTADVAIEPASVVAVTIVVIVNVGAEAVAAAVSSPKVI